MFPKLKVKMMQRMKLNDVSTKKAKESLKVAIDRLYSHYQEHKFLAGNQFSRADLTAASLLAPLYMPEKYDLSWPDKLPGQIEELVTEFSGKTKWVLDFYKKYR